MLKAIPAMTQANAVNAILAFFERTAGRERGIARERAKSIFPSCRRRTAACAGARDTSAPRGGQRGKTLCRGMRSGRTRLEEGRDVELEDVRVELVQRLGARLQRLFRQFAETSE